MSANERIGKLEALLARIQANAAAPRAVAAPTAIPTVPPSAEARAALRSESSEFEAATDQERVVVPEPEESRARLVAAGPAIDIDVEEEVMELDERNVVSEVEVAEVAAAAPAPALEEEPPPSSRRPIAEPAESPQEAQLPIATSAPLTPPPESGKQVAAEGLSFDDDFTGVRESAARLQSKPPEPVVELESLREPTPPPPPDELEAEIEAPPPLFSPSEPEVAVLRGEETRPPPGPMPLPRTEAPAPPKPEVTRPTTPVAASDVAAMVGSVPAFEPKNFGELLDATLSL